MIKHVERYIRLTLNTHHTRGRGAQNVRVVWLANDQLTVEMLQVGEALLHPLVRNWLERTTQYNTVADDGAHAVELGRGEDWELEQRLIEG